MTPCAKPEVSLCDVAKCRQERTERQLWVTCTEQLKFGWTCGLDIMRTDSVYRLGNKETAMLTNITK